MSFNSLKVGFRGTPNGSQKPKQAQSQNETTSQPTSWNSFFFNVGKQMTKVVPNKRKRRASRKVSIQSVKSNVKAIHDSAEEKGTNPFDEWRSPHQLHGAEVEQCLATLKRISVAMQFCQQHYHSTRNSSVCLIHFRRQLARAKIHLNRYREAYEQLWVGTTRIQYERMHTIYAKQLKAICASVDGLNAVANFSIYSRAQVQHLREGEEGADESTSQGDSKVLYFAHIVHDWEMDCQEQTFSDPVLECDVQMRDVPLSQSAALFWGEPLGWSLDPTEAAPPNDGVDYVGQGPERLQSLANLRVVQISCGHRHSGLVTTNGLLFTFGHGECGRLGHGTSLSLEAPRQVKRLKHHWVHHVSCGREHTLAVTREGRVFSWGWGEAGRLGYGDTGAQLWPREVALLSRSQGNAVAATCGREFSVVMTTSGKLFAFGAGCHGQLGLGRAQPQQNVPVEVRGALRNKVVVQVAAGDAHVVCATADGCVYTWGFGGSGALGTGGLNSSPEPLQVRLPDGAGGTKRPAVVTVAAGAYHCAVLLSNGQLVGWGDNSSCQVALDRTLVETAMPMKPGEEPAVSDRLLVPAVVATRRYLIHVECGGNATVAVDKRGRLFFWGERIGGHQMESSSEERGMQRIETYGSVVRASIGTSHLVATTG